MLRWVLGWFESYRFLYKYNLAKVAPLCCRVIIVVLYLFCRFIIILYELLFVKFLAVCCVLFSFYNGFIIFLLFFCFFFIFPVVQVKKLCPVFCLFRLLKPIYYFKDIFKDSFLNVLIFLVSYNNCITLNCFNKTYFLILDFFYIMTKRDCSSPKLCVMNTNASHIKLSWHNTKNVSKVHPDTLRGKWYWLLL